MCVSVITEKFLKSQPRTWISLVPFRRTYCKGADENATIFSAAMALVVAFRRSRAAVDPSCLWCSFIWPPGLLFTGVCPSINYCTQLLSFTSTRAFAETSSSSFHRNFLASSVFQGVADRRWKIPSTSRSLQSFWLRNVFSILFESAKNSFKASLNFKLCLAVFRQTQIRPFIGM